MPGLRRHAKNRSETAGQRSAAGGNLEQNPNGQARDVVVLTYGTFDLLHYGHIRLLQRARSLGSRLVVGLSTEEFCRQKGKCCIFTYEERKEMLEALSCVDLVFPETCWEQKTSDLAAYHVDIFVMGDDWAGSFDELNCVYLPRTEGISTTCIKKKRVVGAVYSGGRRGLYGKGR